MARYMLNTRTGSITTLLDDDDEAYLLLRNARWGPAQLTYTELRADDPRVTPHSGGGGEPMVLPSFVYGDGTDGAHVCTDGEQIQGGMYTDFTIPEGVTVTVATSTQPQVINCTGTLTVAGTVDLSGSNATGSAAGGSGPRSGAPGDPNAGGSASQSIGGPSSGDGGAGSAGPGGAFMPSDNPGWSQAWRGVFTAMLPAGYRGSTGGAGGTGDTTNYGGGGGGGGDSVVFAARHLVHADTNNYALTGGRGGDAGDDGAGGPTGNGDCGSGGGGADGWWITVSDDIAGVANITGGGGQPGTPCGTGVAGTAGAAGFVIHYTPAGVSVENA